MQVLYASNLYFCQNTRDTTVNCYHKTFMTLKVYSRIFSALFRRIATNVHIREELRPFYFVNFRLKHFGVP